jgi:hypothetical protein
MAQFDLYVDVIAGELVGGPANATGAAFPRLVQGDTISLRVYLLQRTTTFPQGTLYSIISNAALSLKIGLGPKTGTAGSTLYAQQFTWSKDASNQYFYADLALNTAAIATLLGANPTATAWFEIEYTQNGFPTTVLQKDVTIHAEVIETGTITTPAGLTAMSAEEANATFLKRENVGFFLTNATTGNKMFVYLGDDDSLHSELVS